MTILTSQLLLLLLLLLSITTFHKSMCSHHTLVSCNEKDRETLLTFNQRINDSLGLISTWSTRKDCCAWKGVQCDNITGRVTELDLSNQYLKGEINFSILELEFLSYLDLSDNDFDSISIPTIPHNITHSSKLVYLDLSTLSFGTLHMDNLHWLSPLSLLKYLNLSGIDLRKETNWLQEVATLPSLLELHMIDCNLNNFMINSSLEYLNLSSLVTLDLSRNNISSQLPNGFFNLTKDITYLGLSFLNIHGNIPSSLLNLQNLRHLNLENNQLQGSIPNGIGQLPNIQYLDLSKNMFSGSIPSTLGNLSSLSYLSIASNNFSGEISKLTFSKLFCLSSLDLGRLNVVFQFDSEWIPPFQLHTLYMENTNQGPNFPSWIYTQKSLQSLSLSNSGISVVDRNMFWSFVGGIHSLSLSNNSLTGDISNLTLNCHNFELDHNNLTGGLPNLSPIAQIVDFSYNSFSGSIPRSWKNLEDLLYINLWSNKLSGEALVHLSHLKQLRVINLGENEFSGTIPIKMPLNLGLLILRANQFEGTIPTLLFNLTSLVHLDLAQNKFSGSMPVCVYNLTNMVTLNTFSWYSSTIEFFTKGHDYMYKL